MKRSVAILVVEDDPALGPAMTDVLTAGGHAPTLASSVEDAFRLLAYPHRLEVVILDLQLGEDRGEKLVHLLRLVGTKLPPVIVLSAQPIPELIRAAKTVGAEFFLQKPCSPQRILEAIELAVA